MSLSAMKIEISLTYDQRLEVLIAELLDGRRILIQAMGARKAEDEQKWLTAIETVLDYYSNDWRETEQK